MRELKVVGLDFSDGRGGTRIVCETAEGSEKFVLRPDDRLRAALNGDALPPQADSEVSNVLTPKEIQSRIRAGASVEQVAGAAGDDVARVERFAHPVLLERSRAAELATAAHPVLADGPAVLTLLETVTTALVARGLDPDATAWDAWRNEDGRWTVQLTWKAGRSDNAAHFRFTPGAHGGTATAFDDAAAELIDPHYDRPALRSVAPVPTLDLSLPEPTPEPAPAPAQEPAKAAAPAKPRTRKRRPEVPGWEDVLLGVRSANQP
ncbi:septation protein SepH [Mycobacterium sp. NPDC006124]|uniref:septation protein SepH n=1 Tax=Mycobacterium sp. NPDC006124 TaxID=3156729 RepID=UPI0033BEF9EF